MLSPLDACWLDLPPSRSHARRRVFWAPRVSLSSPDADASTYAALVHLQHGWRSGNRISRDSYTVELHGPVPGAMAWQFVWSRLERRELGPQERPDPYLVVVGPSMHSCNCTAGAMRNLCCRHRSATLAAIADGLVEGVDPWPGICDPGAGEVPDYDAPGGDALRCGQAFPDEVMA